MKILFCNEGFILDGVASYNLYLSALLKRLGHDVAIIGRWAGPGGFQRRHRERGVRVIQYPSITVSNVLLLYAARKFRPDVLITDSRRSFPLSQKIRKFTNSKVITVFHDPYSSKHKKGRDIPSLLQGSDAWVTPEEPIYEELLPNSQNLPCFFIPRPLTEMITPTACPPRDPFRVLLLGRLSGWKSPGFKAIIENSLELKKKIPSLEIHVVGGGRRRIKFWLAARKLNAAQKEKFIHIVGPQIDPGPWIQRATAVCAGATSAVEALLSNRPTIAFSGFWAGNITKENLQSGISSHFGERQGALRIKDHPEVVLNGIAHFYQHWNQNHIEEDLAHIGKEIRRIFDSASIAEKFSNIFRSLR